MGLNDSTFLQACRKQNDGRLPIWIMRQAGRYLPEYQEVRTKVSFQELCQRPDLIAEVVRQPVHRFGLDAAILFSDILTMLDPMGIKVTFPDGGPVLANPIKSIEDVRALRDIDPVKELPYALDGIRKIRELLPDTPLIGFAGSPFTLAGYLIEGGGSKTFNLAKRFLFEQQEATDELFELLTKNLASYLRAQIDAGAQTVQLFESWGGVLGHDAFKRYVIEPTTRIFESIADTNVPRILFVNNVAPYLDLVKDVPCEVIGVDYRLPLKTAMDALPDKAVQGNLDPSVLFAGPQATTRALHAMLDSVTDYSRLIVNLGHGIQPEAPVESVQALVEAVHAYRGNVCQQSTTTTR